MGPVISERAAKDVEQQINLQSSRVESLFTAVRGMVLHYPTVIEVTQRWILRAIWRSLDLYPIITFETMEEAIEIQTTASSVSPPEL